MADSDRGASFSSSAEFMTTHWSAVLGAADKNEPRAREALAVLCHTYWYPLYSSSLRHPAGAGRGLRRPAGQSAVHWLFQ
jgi:hypothetical protein